MGARYHFLWRNGGAASHITPKATLILMELGDDAVERFDALNSTARLTSSKVSASGSSGLKVT